MSLEISSGAPSSSDLASRGFSSYLEHIAQSYKAEDFDAKKEAEIVPVLNKCGSWFSHGDCLTGHRFSVKIACRHEWCPTCRELAHNKRFAVWLPKAQKMDSFAELNVTFRPEDRPRSQEAFRRQKIALKRLFKREGFSRGFSRGHYFGKKSQRWNSHHNFFMEGGHLEPEELKDLKKKIRGIVGVPNAGVWYRYIHIVGDKEARILATKKVVNALKYITRPTFLKRYWDLEMAEEFFDKWEEAEDPRTGQIKRKRIVFRNSTTWGKWDGPDKWVLPEVERRLGYITKIHNSICPICGEKICWHGVIKKDDLLLLGFEQIWKNVWQVRPPPEIVLTFNLMGEFLRVLEFGPAGDSVNVEGRFFFDGPGAVVPGVVATCDDDGFSPPFEGSPSHRVENNEDGPFGGLGGKAPSSFWDDKTIPFWG